MKKYDYYRPAVRPPAKKKKIRKNFSLSFLKPLLICLILTGLCWLGYTAAVRLYSALSASRLGQWKPKTVSLSGIEGAIAEEIQATAQGKLGAPFAVSDGVQMQEEFAQKYPQLRKIRVKRGLLSGTIRIHIDPRKPIAKFTLPGGWERFIDQDGTVYADLNAAAPSAVPLVQLQGETPKKLDKELVGLLKSMLKFKQQLHFTLLQIDLQQNTVTLLLPDESVIYLGPAQDLQRKVNRAIQIETLARGTQQQPHVLDFTYFEDGKVFLRQKAL